MSLVYVSLPLTGPTGEAGRERLRGIDLANPGLEVVALEGFYGYEAMALVRDAIAAGGDRGGVVQAMRATRDRDSVLGRDSIDERGHTTCTAYCVLAGGKIVWERT
jgi:hypothetical protein